MPNFFNITTSTSNTVLDAQGTGKVSFTVSNTSGRTVQARARVMPQDPSTASWFTIGGQSNRTMVANGTEQYTVQIAAPAGSLPKDYTFSLLVVEESNPDENFTEGPSVRFTVPARAVEPAKQGIPWWIIAIAVVAVIIVIGAIAAIANGNSQAALAAAQTATMQANNTGTAVINNNATLAAAALTATANARATQTAVSLTQTALAPTSTPIPRPPQTITVHNNGGFVARFSVTWDVPGGPSGSDSSGDITLGTQKTIVVPGNAINVAVKVEENTGFGMNTACSPVYPQAISRDITVSGTTFSPSCQGDVVQQVPR